MNKFFDLDNPFMSALSTIADLMILNLLTTLCCLPIFTAGASFAALHYVLLKMVRGEEGYITKSFFTQFKANFKQATGMWLIMLAAAAVFGGDYYIFQHYPETVPKAMMLIIMAIGIFLYVSFTFTFPLQSHFVNKVKTTLKNSILLTILHLPTAFAMAILYIVPVIAIFKLTPYLYPLIFLFGFSAPAYGSAYLYSRVFKKMGDTPEDNETSDMEFEVNTDGVDTADNIDNTDNTSSDTKHN